MNEYSRRHVLLALPSLGLASLGAASVAPRELYAQPTGPGIELEPFPSAWLPDGVRSRFVNNINGLRVHVLEAGYQTPNRSALLLLHGFPELAYSWRNVMVPLAEAGYHVIAPDVPRLRSHHRLALGLRYGPRAISAAEQGARCPGPGAGVRLPICRRRDRP